MWCRSRTLSLSVILLFLSAAAAAAVPATQAGHEAGHWSWYAPADATGPGAFRVTIDFGSDNDCSLSIEGTSRVNEGPALRIHAEGLFTATGSGGGFFHVHADAFDIDTRSDFGTIGMRGSSEPTLDGTRTFTILTGDMPGQALGSSDPLMPAGISITCADPIHVVALAGSREMVAVGAASMSGGAGAHADGIFADAVVAYGDGMEAAFGSDWVEVAVAHFATASVYAWELRTPSHHVTSSGASGATEATLRDGPGLYRFDLDVAGVHDRLEVWMAGFTAVQTLDQVLA